ncbi:hypothetical protein [Allosalinactinospora lopnorensis]|uniref:hypothetical protein n=1 Tax=Allosalinactinospora lopnorensis TaxID=1352348 RepID=UPI000623FB93|nr:hypothetical protein [Allosalinactinospora lopnorensis]
MSRLKKTDWASFVAGLLFVSLGVVFVISGSTNWSFGAIWILPVLAIGLGIVAIARALVRARDRREPGPDAET